MGPATVILWEKLHCHLLWTSQAPAPPGKMEGRLRNRVVKGFQQACEAAGGLCGLSISYQACGSTSGGLLLQDEEWHMFWWAGTLLLDVKGH